jgi:hypothetical protein
MYLTPEVLEWKAEAEGSSIPDQSLWKRAYKIWAHAEQVLSCPTTEFQRVDAITTLKRASDHRVRLLNDFYSLRNISIKGKPSEILYLLEFVGIIRPLMLQKLIDIRNAVEHEDASPPSHEDCQVFLEFMWYFLRSTDKLTQYVLEDIGLRPFGEDENYYWLTVSSGPEHNWVPKLFGWVKPDMLSNEPKDNWLVLNVERTETREELIERLRDEVKEGETGRGKYLDDVCLHVEVRGPTDALVKLLKIYFEAV